MRPRQPRPYKQLCHSGHRHSHRCRASQLREAVEQSHPHTQLRHLALKRAGHHPLAQAFEAMHLGLHQAFSVVAAPLLPDLPPHPLAGSQRCIAQRRTHQSFLPRLIVLARGNHRLRASLGYRRMAAFSVICTVGTHTGYRFMLRYLHQKFGQHGVSPTRLSVTSMARVSSVWASMPKCTLRRCRRYSAPCFLRLHSPSPRNLVPVLPIRRSSAVLLRWEMDTDQNRT